MKKNYCTQNSGKCSTCSLVNYGMDCANNPLPSPKTSQTKIERLIAKGHWHKGPVTTKAVLEQIPQALIPTLSSTQLAMIADAINTAYHAGRASAGAEVIDESPTDGAVWINCINRAIEWHGKAGQELIAKLG